MKSEEEWMIQWTNVNQNLIAILVFFKWKWVFLYQIDLDSRGKLLALFLWKELTREKEIRNWSACVENDKEILITCVIFANEVCGTKSGLNINITTAVRMSYKESRVLEIRE